MKLYYDKESKNHIYFIQQGIRNGKKRLLEILKELENIVVNCFLLLSCILELRSKLGIYDHLNMYYEQPKFHYCDSLRFLSLLADNFDDYIAHFYKESNNIIKRNTPTCYFEIKTNDEDYIDEVTVEGISGLRKYGISK